MATISDGSVLEVTTFNILAGTQDKFEPALKEVCDIVSKQEGYIGHIVQKCVEADTRYTLLINWQRIEDHTETFGKSATAERCGALLSEYFDGMPTSEHYLPF